MHDMLLERIREMLYATRYGLGSGYDCSCRTRLLRSEAYMCQPQIHSRSATSEKHMRSTIWNIIFRRRSSRAPDLVLIRLATTVLVLELELSNPAVGESLLELVACSSLRMSCVAATVRRMLYHGGHA